MQGCKYGIRGIFATDLLTNGVENVLIPLRLSSTAADDTAASVFLSPASPATRMLYGIRGIFVTDLLTNGVENVLIPLRLSSTAADDTAASVFLLFCIACDAHILTKVSPRHTCLW